MKLYTKVPIRQILKFVYQLCETFVFWYEKYIIVPDLAVRIRDYIDELKNQSDVQVDYEALLDIQELLGRDLDEQ